jgi:hypothetical protein
MTVGVVDALEMIDVGQQHQRRFPGPGHPVDLAVQRQLELAAVRQAGEGVAAGQAAQSVDHRLQPGWRTHRGINRPTVLRPLEQLQCHPQVQGSAGHLRRGEVVSIVGVERVQGLRPLLRTGSRQHSLCWDFGPI